MGKCCSKRQEPQPIGYTKADTGLSSKHSNGGSLDRYTADPNQRGVQARADIIRPRPTPCKIQIPQQPRKTSSPVVMPASHSQRANKIVVALYNYTARESTDVSFVKGDRMEVLDDTEPDWWKVLHLTTLQEGLIPWNFVAVERSVESEDWFFENVSRKEAGKLLLVDENPRGTFLVRPSEHNPRGYSLSVKDWEEGRGHHVKHYKIKPLDNGGFFIATNQTFPTLPALVMAYSSEYIIT
ncbi:hypothetical protein M0804_006148 [Polistes exclamans]|nr:hypothetical protein M0804_006148 [Polistes exclamans]